MYLKPNLKFIPSLFIALMILPACGALSGGGSSGGDTRAQQFVDAFFKEKFFEQIDEERADYEEMVRKLKARGLEKDNLKRAYADARIAYNAVLNMMSDDINAVRNIAAFGLFDAETRYYADLERARKSGSAFYELAEKELNDGIMGDAGFVTFLVLEVYPLIKNVHDRSLEYCKKRMTARIKQSTFKTWGEIS